MPRLRPHGTVLGGALSNAQRQLLLYDQVFLETPGEAGFDNDQQARAAWRAHSAELMAEFGDQPGRRPAGWWAYEVRIDPPAHWYQEAGELEERNLLSKDEEFRLERDRRELAANQGDFASAMFTHKWSPYLLREYEARFRFAAAWHRRRGRVELAAKYEHLAAVAAAELAKAKGERP